MNRRKILIVDDEGSIRRTLKMNLEPEGYEIVEAATAATGLAMLNSEKPNLIILDLGLPDRKGLAVLKEIREWSIVPVVVLTVADDEKTKVELLESGADDYITKPFGMAELKARITVALRHQTSQNEADPIFKFGSVAVDLSQRKVFKNEIQIHLTATEMNLLKVLLKARGAVVPQEEILKDVWGESGPENPHYLRIYIAQLRKKLEDEPSSPKHILTEPGVGYRLV